MRLTATLHRWANTNWIVLINASSLVSTTAVTSVLGFIYWWVAARHFPADVVGLASAAISAMLLLSSISSLGLGTLLVGELARQLDKRPSLVVTALIAVITAAVILGAGFVVTAPLLATNLKPLETSIFSLTLFTLGVALGSATIVLDQAMIGLLRGGLQLWRNGLFAGIKLILLVGVGLWVSNRSWTIIYLTWVLGIIGSLLFLAFIATQSGTSLRAYRPRWELLKQFKKAALDHHALNLTLQGPSLALPVLTTITLSATANAYFYAAWMIARFVFVGPISLTTVLHAVGIAEPEEFARKLRHSILMSVLIGLVLNAFVLLGAELILSFFGHEYARQAAASLRLLALAVFPLTIRYHYTALARIQGWMGKAALLMGAGALLELGLAAVGAKLGGLTGLSIGWLSAIFVEAICMAYPVYRAAIPKPKSIQNSLGDK